MPPGQAEIGARGRCVARARERGFVAPEDFADFFKQNYGPTLKAFEALAEEKRPALYADLVDLARRSNSSTDSTVRIPSEYLEIVAERTRA